jgi:hypothetical protein
MLALRLERRAVLLCGDRDLLPAPGRPLLLGAPGLSSMREPGATAMTTRTFRGGDREFFLTCVAALLAYGVPRDEAAVIAGEITERLGPKPRPDGATSRGKQAYGDRR